MGLLAGVGQEAPDVWQMFRASIMLLPALLLAFLFGLAIYRLYFHPLAKYPGPFFSRISPMPITISLLRGRMPMWVKRQHDIYGPIVRVAPNELSFDDAPAWKGIYGSRPGHKNFHKDPIHVGSVEPVHGVSTITMADDETHARQRRALSYAFSTKALLEQEYILQGYIETFSEKMKEFAKTGETVDITDWFAYATFDIIGHLALGEPFGCMEKPDARFWVPMISHTIKAGAIEQATNRLATAGSRMQKFLKRCIPRSVRGPRLNHLDYSRQLVLKRMSQRNNEHRDFIHYLLKQNEAGNLDKNEIIINGALFIVAGTETTAGFLAGLFNHLLRNPPILNRLKKEIRSSFELEEDIRFEALVKLPYLTAVIEEGLRIYPSAAIGFTRTVPGGGDTVCGEYLPGGTTVSVCMWAATHSERNFKDPYKYDPERWLGDPKYASDKLSASNAFSLGPRGCIGRNLSYMEQKLIIAKMLWHNDIEFAGPNEAWDPEGDYKNKKVFTNWMKDPLLIKLAPRRLNEGLKGE